MTQNHAFREAQNFVMPFGQHKGRTLDNIAESDDGLKYLDWLNGQNLVNGRLKTALVVYLSDPTIKKELEAIT